MKAPRVPKPQGKWLFPYIWNKLYKDNENFFCIITGLSGKGKSTVALKIAESFDPSFVVEKDIFFDARSFINRLVELDDEFRSCKTIKARYEKVKGRALILDEGVLVGDSHKWHAKDVENLKRAFNIQRYLGLIVIVCVPDATQFISSGNRLMHVEIVCKGKNVKERLNYIKAYQLYFSRQSKHNYRFPKIKNSKRGKKKLRSMTISAPSKKLMKAYDIYSHKIKGEALRAMKAELEKQMADSEAKKPSVVISKYKKTVIKNLLDNGFSKPKIARITGMSERRVYELVHQL